MGLYRVDRLMWKGAWNRLPRRGPQALPNGWPLTYLERGGYGTALAIVFVSLLVELPLHALIIKLFIKDPVMLAIVHGCGAIAAVSTLVGTGDRWHVGGAGRHPLVGDTLHLQVGRAPPGRCRFAQSSGLRLLTCRFGNGGARVAYQAAIRLSSHLLTSPTAYWSCGRRHRLTLHIGMRKRLPKYVFLYLDQPETLRAHLHQH